MNIQINIKNFQCYAAIIDVIANFKEENLLDVEAIWIICILFCSKAKIYGTCEYVLMIPSATYILSA